MKLIPKLIIIVLLFFVSSDFVLAEQEKIVSHTLNNGLKVLILEKDSMPVVSVQVWYHVGSIDEPNGLKGIAHLFEHMMFRGSKNFGPQEHFQLINAAGGNCNAYTSDERTVYYERVPADKLDLVLRLEADRMVWLKLDQNVLDTERQVVMEEYRMRVDNDPIGSIQRDVRMFLFANNPFEFGPIGKMEDIANFTVEDCQKFYNTYYAPNNATLVIVGDVKADEAIKMVEERFGFITPSNVPKRASVSLSPEQAAAVNKSTTELPVPVSLLTFYTAGARDEDRPALEVLLYGLVDGKSSRIWKTLVKDTKLAEYFTGEYIEGADNGIVIFAAAHLPSLSKKVEKTIWDELEKIKKSGLDDNEFEKIRNQIRSGNIFEKYHVNQLASTIGYSEVVRGDYELFYQQDKEIENVTQEDIIRVTNRYFNRDNVRTVYFEPREKNFLASLAGFFKSIFK
ncbi:MAG: Protease 3 precursor [Planctomycetes bacterium ADurb.Bin401]|nr:MAG: Protease 3 precursor [Planctomycetes bacterium ADurb.Bin401]